MVVIYFWELATTRNNLQLEQAQWKAASICHICLHSHCYSENAADLRLTNNSSDAHSCQHAFCLERKAEAAALPQDKCVSCWSWVVSLHTGHCWCSHHSPGAPQLHCQRQLLHVLETAGKAWEWNTVLGAWPSGHGRFCKCFMIWLVTCITPKVPSHLSAAYLWKLSSNSGYSLVCFLLQLFLILQVNICSHGSRCQNHVNLTSSQWLKDSV